MQKPTYNCHNGECLPTGSVQGDHIISKYDDAYIYKYGYYVPKNLNQLYPNSIQSQIDSQTNSDENANTEPLKAEIRLMSVAVTNSPVYIGCGAEGGTPPYQITLKMPPPLWGSDTKMFNANFGMISETFLIPHDSVTFTCNVQDASGNQASNFTDVSVADGSQTSSVPNSVNTGVQPMIVSSITHPDQYCCGHYTAGDNGNTQNNYNAPPSQNTAQQPQVDGFVFNNWLFLAVLICVTLVAIFFAIAWAIRPPRQIPPRPTEIRVQDASNANVKTTVISERDAISGIRTDTTRVEIEERVVISRKNVWNKLQSYKKDFFERGLATWVLIHKNDVDRIFSTATSEDDVVKRIVDAWRKSIDSGETTKL
ncbi:MAG: hypothetical protein ACREBB_06625 [Nitrosotalea sp.]